MTRELALEEIPEMYRNTLAATAAQIIKRHKTSAYVSVSSEKQNFQYILWAGLNAEQQLEECYFISNDFVSRNVLINR